MSAISQQISNVLCVLSARTLQQILVAHTLQIFSDPDSVRTDVNHGSVFFKYG